MVVKLEVMTNFGKRKYMGEGDLVWSFSKITF